MPAQILGCRAASGRLPSSVCGRPAGRCRGPWPVPRPGASSAAPRAGQKARRNANSTSQRQLAGRRGGGHRGRRQECGADPQLRRCSGSRPSTGALRRNRRRQRASADAGGRGLSGCSQRSPPGAGPQAWRKLTSRPRRGPSEQLAGSATGSAGAAGSGMARGPRPTNGRNGSAEGAGD
ncbi:hypothetical protein GHT09_009248 [Marmota monax]|uniref:Uncharacterized protein n=1 Tax=Marmota monax TaxID=9995 RepID=A0A834PPV4_MARMO|nr:hypothetical protein GHT09_009248 [Marmota monax]